MKQLFRTATIFSSLLVVLSLMSYAYSQPGNTWQPGQPGTRPPSPRPPSSRQFPGQQAQPERTQPGSTPAQPQTGRGQQQAGTGQPGQPRPTQRVVPGSTQQPVTPAQPDPKITLPERPNVKLSTQAKEISDHLDKGNMSAAKTLIDSYATICVKDPGYHVQHARYLFRYHKLAVSEKAFYYINEGNKNFPSEKIPISSDEIINKCQAAIEFDEDFTPYVMDMLYREIYEQIVETKMNNPIVVIDLLIQYIKQNKGDIPFISSMIDIQKQIERTEKGEDSIFALYTQGLFIASMINVDKASGFQAGLSIKNTPLAKKTLDVVAQWHQQLIKLRDGYVNNKLWGSAFAITDSFFGEVDIIIQLREESFANGETDLLMVFQKVGIASELSIKHFESLLDFVIDNESVFKNNKDAAFALGDRFIFLANTYVKGNELEKRGIDLPMFLSAMFTMRHQDKYAKVVEIFGEHPLAIRGEFFNEVLR